MSADDKVLKSNWNKHVHRDAVLASDLSAHAKIVLIAIGNRVNSKRPFITYDDANCLTVWSGHDSIAKDTSLSVTTVKKAIKEAIAKGYLMIKGRPGTSNLYHLWFDYDAEWKAVVDTFFIVGVGARRLPPRREAPTPPEAPRRVAPTPQARGAYEHGNEPREVKENTVTEVPAPAARALETKPLYQGDEGPGDVRPALEAVDGSLADWDEARVALVQVDDLVPAERHWCRPGSACDVCDALYEDDVAYTTQVA